MDTSFVVKVGCSEDFVGENEKRDSGGAVHIRCGVVAACIQPCLTASVLYIELPDSRDLRPG